MQYPLVNILIIFLLTSPAKIYRYCKGYKHEKQFPELHLSQCLQDSLKDLLGKNHTNIFNPSSRLTNALFKGGFFQKIFLQNHLLIQDNHKTAISNSIDKRHEQSLCNILQFQISA